MSIINATISALVTGASVWYGIMTLTGNNIASFAFGLAVGWSVYQVVLSLGKIEGFLRKIIDKQ